MALTRESIAKWRTVARFGSTGSAACPYLPESRFATFNTMTFNMPRLHKVDAPLASGARIGRHGISTGPGERAIGTAVTTLSTFGGQVLVMRGNLVLSTTNLYVVFDEIPAVYTRNGRSQPNAAQVGHTKISGIRSPLGRRNADRVAAQNLYASVVDLADVQVVEESDSERNGYHLRLRSALTNGASISIKLDGDRATSRQFVQAVLAAVVEHTHADTPVPKYESYIDRKGRKNTSITWPITPEGPSFEASASPHPSEGTALTSPVSPTPSPSQVSRVSPLLAPQGKSLTPPMPQPFVPEVEAITMPIRRAATNLSMATREAVQRFVVQVAPKRPIAGFIFAAEPDALMVVSEGLMFVCTPTELQKVLLARLHINHGLSPSNEIKWVEIEGRRYSGLNPSDRIEPFLKYLRSSPIPLPPE
jgi:hypothetical protein